MNKENIKEYREKLEHGIEEYMTMPISQRSSEAIRAMIDCWEHVKNMEETVCGHTDSDITLEEAEEWCAHMENEDGTTGPHWTMAETSRFNDINVPDCVWWAAMNMIYSDYCGIIIAYGMNRTDFYVELTKAFLTDKDAKGPVEKLTAYYHYIVL